MKCAGTCENASNVYEYYGIKDCTMANLMQDGGQKDVLMDVLDSEAV